MHSLSMLNAHKSNPLSNDNFYKLRHKLAEASRHNFTCAVDHNADGRIDYWLLDDDYVDVEDDNLRYFSYYYKQKLIKIKDHRLYDGLDVATRVCYELLLLNTPYAQIIRATGMDILK